MTRWIFEHNEGDTSRYILGELGENNLICIGINPSTATPENLDPTLKKVRTIAQQHGYDGWVMLNVYPQRDANPANIHSKQEDTIITANQNQIRNLLQIGNFRDVWAAWGDEICRRNYLGHCLRGVVGCFDETFTWGHFGALTIKGHPKHPSRIGYNNQFTEFDINEYITNFKK